MLTSKKYTRDCSATFGIISSHSGDIVLGECILVTELKTYWEWEYVSKFCWKYSSANLRKQILL